MKKIITFIKEFDYILAMFYFIAALFASCIIFADF